MAQMRSYIFKSCCMHALNKCVLCGAGMCILAETAKLKSGVANATCGCLEYPCKPAAPNTVACGYWTGPVWPTKKGLRDPGYIPDPGCPPSGCLFHLPSDPSGKFILHASCQLTQLRVNTRWSDSRLCCCAATQHTYAHSYMYAQKKTSCLRGIPTN